MKGIILSFSGLVCGMTGIVLLILSLQNTWYDSTIRHAYHQSMEYTIRQESGSDAFSLDTFKERFLLLSPADVTYDIALKAWHEYPKLMRVHVIARKPNRMIFALDETILEEREQ